MNILYYSVHQVLEDDEVRLFQRLGHNVICLGTSGISGAAQSFRPPIRFSQKEGELYRAFEALGGHYTFGCQISEIIIPEEFMRLVDVTIVMYLAEFISHFWDVICAKPVVWRTIAQGVDVFDEILRPYRKAGLRIVRKSPMERPVNTLGQDAVIRFGKSPDEFNGWIGNEKTITTFTHTYKQRYPADAIDYERITQGFPAKLGGAGNEEMVNAIGTVSSEEQNEMLRSSRAYLYASAIDVPYTLNFIEAWMTGIPVVVHSPQNRQGPYFEIDRLIKDNENGFLCRDVEETRHRLAQLLDDEALGKRIGSAGRASAVDLFGAAKNEREWSLFLSKVKTFPPAMPLNSDQKRNAVSRIRENVFGKFGKWQRRRRLLRK